LDTIKESAHKVSKFDVKYTDEYADRLPSLFERGMSISQVCRELKISRQTYYTWRETYPEFGKAANYGETTAQAFHEDLLDAGANGEIDGFNVTAKIFAMKNRYRETYGEQKQAPNALSAIETLLNIMHDKPAK
jgi:transposase-like protein